MHIQIIIKDRLHWYINLQSDFTAQLQYSYSQVNKWPPRTPPTGSPATIYKPSTGGVANDHANWRMPQFHFISKWQKEMVCNQCKASKTVRAWLPGSTREAKGKKMNYHFVVVCLHQPVKLHFHPCLSRLIIIYLVKIENAVKGVTYIFLPKWKLSQCWHVWFQRIILKHTVFTWRLFSTVTTMLQRMDVAANIFTKD